MSCPEELDLFLMREGGGELSKEREREVAEHLTSCASCQTKMAELQAVADALSRPATLSEGERSAFVADVLRKIDEKAQTSAPIQGPSSFWSKGVPIVAALCCGVMAIVAIPLFMVFQGDQADEAAAVGAAPIVSYAIPETTEAEESSADRYSSTQAAPPVMPQSSNLRGGGGGASTSSADSPPPPAPAQATSPAPADVSPLMGLSLDSADGVGSRGYEGEATKGYARGRSSGGSRDIPSELARSAKRSRPMSARRGNLAEQQNKAAQQGWIQPGYPSPNGQGIVSSHSSTLSRAAAQPVAIDPNGRFATTYRPGRGHTARFEQALLHGQVPQPAIALVADEGRGHGPVINAPTDRALALDIRSGLRQLPPEGGPVHVAITLRSNAEAPANRPPVAVHLVMDTSGSMSGTAIQQARQAAQRLVTMLQDEDRFSLVSYNTSARVVINDGTVGPRRSSIVRQIMALNAGGGTNLEAGLRQGYEQARQSRRSEDSVQLVIVLSDGQPNQGVTDPWQLSEQSAAAFQSGIETTTIGVGDRYEPQVMSTIAEYGAGGYYYLPDTSIIEQVLRTELDVRTQPVARGVELRVRLGDGVELLQAYGSRRLNQAEAQRVRATEVAIDHQSAHRDGIVRDRQEDREGGMRFFIPGFAGDDQHTILLRLRVPAGANDCTLASVELRYKDRITQSNQGDERNLRVAYAANRQVALSTSDPDVRRAVYAFRTGEALTEVSSLLTVGDQQNALALLYERVEMLRHAAEEMNDATLRADAERLDSFRGVVAERALNNNLMLGSMLQRAGRGFMR